MSTASAVAKLLVNIGPADRIPLGEGRQFLIGMELIAVFRTRDGGIFATQASCTHKGGPLADGLVGDHKIVCPLHTFAFDLRSGQPLGHACAALTTYVASLNSKGEILVEIE
jgi:nitrite reductase (NADH) small subunit